MINLFQFAANDQSLTYLYYIFGSMNGVIHPAGEASGTTINLLGTMFRAFNSVILVVAALIVVYITVAGVIMTAHEGEFMGKKFNGIWTPIRVVLGIVSLVPTASGFCVLQIVMMWVIVQGIGAADMLWTRVINFSNVTGSPYANATIPTITTQSVMNTLFQGLVCDETARLSLKNPSGIRNAGYYCAQKSDTWCRARPNFDGSKTEYVLGPQGGLCGTLTYCNYNASCAKGQDLKCQACAAQQEALKSIIPTLRNVAIIFVNADYQYRNFYYNSYNNPMNDWGWISDYCRAQNIDVAKGECCVPTSRRKREGYCQSQAQFPDVNDGKYPQNPSAAAVRTMLWPYGTRPKIPEGNFIDTSVGIYSSNIGKAVSDYIAQQSKNNNNLPQELANAQKAGWIFAGAYYYVLSKMNDNNLAASLPALGMRNFNTQESILDKYRNNANAALELLDAVTDATDQAAGDGGGGASGGATGSAPKQLGRIAKPFSSTVNGVAKALYTTSTTSLPTTKNITPNPIVQLQTVGRIFIIYAEALFVILLTASIYMGLLGYFTGFFFGSGVINPIGAAVTMAYFFLAPAIIGFLALLITLGGLFAIYTPLIPYIIFTFGAIGWLISTIEAMVAGPLVALGIMSPSTHHHEILGKAEISLMMIFHIFLRPSLMIFGLIAAMFLVSVVVAMINYAFWSIVRRGVVLSVDPVELVIYLCAYVSLILAAINKCFTVIHVIPERVLSWISHQAQQEGAAEALGEVKGGVSAATGKMGGGLDVARGAVEASAGREAQESAQATKMASDARAQGIEAEKAAQAAAQKTEKKS